MTSEPTNEDRAQRAHASLEFYVEKCKQEVWEGDLNIEIGDFLADLKHLCRREGIDFEDCLRVADMHFTAEVDEEGDCIRHPVEIIRHIAEHHPEALGYPPGTEVYHDSFDQAKILLDSAAIDDTARLQHLRELMGYVEDGSDSTVRLFQDDATKNFFVKVSKRSWFGSSFREAIDESIRSNNENPV
jgi:hypothetical protein